MIIKFDFNNNETVNSGEAIKKAVEKNSNSTSMESKDKESASPPNDSFSTIEIDIITYTFHLNDSTISKSAKKIKFEGNDKDVQKKYDSINKVNETTEHNNNAWLKDWNKN